MQWNLCLSVFMSTIARAKLFLVGCMSDTVSDIRTHTFTSYKFVLKTIGWPLSFIIGWWWWWRATATVGCLAKLWPTKATHVNNEKERKGKLFVSIYRWLDGWFVFDLCSCSFFVTTHTKSVPLCNINAIYYLGQVSHQSVREKIEAKVTFSYQMLSEKRWTRE